MKTVKATVALHNWLKDEEEEEDTLQPVDRAIAVPGLNAEIMRDRLAEFFMSEEGEFPPQWDIVHRTSNT